MIDLQKHLLYSTNLVVTRNLESNKLRGVQAIWKDEEPLVCLYFYFAESLTDEDYEMAWDMSAGIIANIPEGLLEEHFIVLNSSHPLPESLYWAYKRVEEKSL